MSYESFGPGAENIDIVQLSIAGSVATVVGTTSFISTLRYAAQSWIFKGVVLLPYGKKPLKVNKIGLWAYPAGGRAKRIFKLADSAAYGFNAVTVSFAPARSHSRH
jgi:hypothetical protein